MLNAREVNFYSLFQTDPVAHPCGESHPEERVSSQTCCCRDFMFLRDVSATFPQLRDGGKSLTQTEEGEEEEEKSRSGESARPCAGGTIHK